LIHEASRADATCENSVVMRAAPTRTVAARTMLVLQPLSAGSNSKRACSLIAFAGHYKRLLINTSPVHITHPPDTLPA